MYTETKHLVHMYSPGQNIYYTCTHQDKTLVHMYSPGQNISTHVLTITRGTLRDILQVCHIVEGSIRTLELSGILGTIRTVVARFTGGRVLYPRGAVGVVLYGAITVVPLGTSLA